MTDASGFWTRFLRVLRQRWWLLVVGAVLMAGLTIAAGGLRRYAATSTVFIGEVTLPNDDDDPESTGPVASLDFLLASIDNAGADAQAAAGESLTVDVTLQSTQRIFVIRTIAGSARGAEQGNEFLVEELQRQHLEQLASAIDPQVAMVEARIEAGRDALEAVDNQLSSAGSVEATGLAIERATRTTELISLEGELSALQGLIDSSPPTISVTSEAAQPILGVTRLALSAVLGLVLGAAAIAALAWLDRRIWDTADLDRAGIDGVLGTAGDGRSGDGALAGVAAAIHHGARGASRIQLVPATGSIDLRPLADALSAELAGHDDAPPVVVAPALDDGSGALVDATGSATVLVVPPGTITSETLRGQLRQFHNVGADNVGVVLAGSRTPS